MKVRVLTFDQDLKKGGGSSLELGASLTIGQPTLYVTTVSALDRYLAPIGEVRGNLTRISDWDVAGRGDVEIQLAFEVGR